MDYTSNITVGMTHEAVDTVTDANTALTVGSGSLAVYATPAMAALMERAAAAMEAAWRATKTPRPDGRHVTEHHASCGDTDGADGTRRCGGDGGGRTCDHAVCHGIRCTRGNRYGDAHTLCRRRIEVHGEGGGQAPP